MFFGFDTFNSKLKFLWATTYKNCVVLLFLLVFFEVVDL